MARTKFDPHTQTTVEYQVPSIDSRPGGIAVDAQDRIWFTEQKGNKIAVFNPSLLEEKEPATTPTTARGASPAKISPIDFKIPTAGGAPATT